MSRVNGPCSSGQFRTVQFSDVKGL